MLDPIVVSVNISRLTSLRLAATALSFLSRSTDTKSVRMQVSSHTGGDGVLTQQLLQVVILPLGIHNRSRLYDWLQKLDRMA